MTIELFPAVAEANSESPAAVVVEPTEQSKSMTATVVVDERSKSPLNETKSSLNVSSSTSTSEKNLSINVASQGSSPNQSPVLTDETTKRTALKRSREPSPDNIKSSKSSRVSSYSIMNILSKDTGDRKPAAEDAISQQQPLSTGSNAGMNQFLMNPFLAAAAAAAFNNNSGGAQLHGQSPWFNMATMSALYGLESMCVC